MSHPPNISETVFAALLLLLTLGETNHVCAQKIDASCQQWEVNQINPAIGAARKLLAETKSAQRTAEWFGPNRSQDWVNWGDTQIKNMFADVGGAARNALGLGTEPTITCDQCRRPTTDVGESDGTGSYVIRLCENFFSLSVTGKDSQAGVLLHEASHTLGTADTESVSLSVVDTYTYARLVVDSPMTILDNGYGHTPALMAPGDYASWPILEANNWEYFYENPDDL